MEKELSEIAKLTERIFKDPKSKLFVPLAEEYKKIGDIEMAIHVLNEGLKQNPGYVTAKTVLGRLLFEHGDLTASRKEFDDVVKVVPDNLLAQKKLGDLCALQNEPLEARKHYEIVLSLNPRDAEVKALIDQISAGIDVAAKIQQQKQTQSGGSKSAPSSLPKQSADLSAAKPPAKAPASEEPSFPNASGTMTQQAPRIASQEEKQERTGTVAGTPTPGTPHVDNVAPAAPAEEPEDVLFVEPLEEESVIAEVELPASVLRESAVTAPDALQDFPEPAAEVPIIEAEPSGAPAVERESETQEFEAPEALFFATEDEVMSAFDAGLEESVGSAPKSEAAKPQEQPTPEHAAAQGEEPEEFSTTFAPDHGDEVIQHEFPSQPEAQEPAVSSISAAAEEPVIGGQSPSSDDFTTNTLAELCIAQGFFEKALEIYKRMAEDHPDNADIRRKLERVTAMAAEAESSPLRREITQPAAVDAGTPAYPETNEPAPLTEHVAQSIPDEAREYVPQVAGEMETEIFPEHEVPGEHAIERSAESSLALDGVVETDALEETAGEMATQGLAEPAVSTGDETIELSIFGEESETRKSSPADEELFGIIQPPDVKTGPVQATKTEQGISYDIFMETPGVEKKIEKPAFEPTEYRIHSDELPFDAAENVAADAMHTPAKDQESIDRLEKWLRTIMKEK